MMIDHDPLGTADALLEEAEAKVAAARSLVAVMRKRPGPEDSSETIGVREAAAELGASYTTVVRWIRAGLLDAFQIAPGKMRRVRRSSVAELQKRLCG